MLGYTKFNENNKLKQLSEVCVNYVLLNSTPCICRIFGFVFANSKMLYYRILALHWLYLKYEVVGYKN